MAKEQVRQDTRVSIRTPRARVAGLGVAHHGVGHWWLQRITAVTNTVLMLSFVVIIARMAGRGLRGRSPRDREPFRLASSSSWPSCR